MNEQVKRTERGWCGHFIGGDDCLYHRNTLLEYGDRKVVVSTIGLYAPTYKRDGREFKKVGPNRYFETMAFLADDSKYHDAVVSKRVCFSSNWGLPDLDMEMEADAMHEAVVAEISNDLMNNTLTIAEY